MLLRFKDRNGLTYLLRDPEPTVTKRGEPAFEFDSYRVEGSGIWHGAGLLPLARAVEWGPVPEELGLEKAA